MVDQIKARYESDAIFKGFIDNKKWKKAHARFNLEIDLDEHPAYAFLEDDFTYEDCLNFQWDGDLKYHRWMFLMQIHAEHDNLRNAMLMDDFLQLPIIVVQEASSRPKDDVRIRMYVRDREETDNHHCVIWKALWDENESLRPNIEQFLRRHGLHNCSVPCMKPGPCLSYLRGETEKDERWFTG